MCRTPVRAHETNCIEHLSERDGLSVDALDSAALHVMMCSFGGQTLIHNDVEHIYTYLLLYEGSGDGSLNIVILS